MGSEKSLLRRKTREDAPRGIIKSEIPSPQEDRTKSWA